MDVRRWSEEFRDSLASELRRAGVSTTTGPLVHVEVRTLDVDSPFAFGASTCRLEANLFVQGPNAVQVFPVVADGRAEKDHTCIGNAFAAMVRHIVASPWLATTSGGPSTVPTSTERAELLPNTDGRYGLQFSLQMGAGAVRLVGGGSASSELGPAFGIALDLPIRQNFFFTGSVQGERAAGALGIGFSHYVASSFLISYSFLAGGDNGSEGTELRVPALGGQVMLGKQWQVSSSFWLGFAVRPWAMWSLDEGRGYGASLFSTVTIN
jgi:hypothetical protein